LHIMKAVVPLVRDNITLIPRSGKEIMIWNDSILGKESLITKNVLAPLKAWMDTVNLRMLFDILVWNENSKNWMRWDFRTPPKPFWPLISNLSHALIGYTPWNLGVEYCRGWGESTYQVKDGYTSLQDSFTLP
jgi:hypothetical protein